MEFNIKIADSNSYIYASEICSMIEESSKIRGTGIAKRKPEYIRGKMEEGKAIIAMHGEKVVGFCYIESWENQKYVANSGLIVHPDYRKTGLAKAIKKATFNLSKKKFPDSKLFGITTSLAVMKINSGLGYKPVTFSELTQDDAFWKGCQTCVNYDILQRTNRTMCLCTAMVCDLNKGRNGHAVEGKNKSWEHFLVFLKNNQLKRKAKAGKLSIIKKLVKHEK